mmetsp:Transcript_9576/g.14087  ORF Transcript_9576/g.14087 Transcript_9576/m.14087 type:complete len:288 (+) Transcript_9576:182-1045(+)
MRKCPKLTPEGRRLCYRIGFYHATGQFLTVMSLGAGPVSFTHIVKALEPFFFAIISALLFDQWMKPQVYASLIFVVGGVGCACYGERSFSWMALTTAMGSNVGFALRAVLSKFVMNTETNSKLGEYITSNNLFGIVTWCAFFLSIPVALVGEGFTFLDLWNKATTTMSETVIMEGAAAAVPDYSNPIRLARAVVTSGLFHYMNNEVMYQTLSKVHPVTLAVGNTMKRVFIMVASVIVFHNPMSLQSVMGSTIGILGVFLYSFFKQHYERAESKMSNSIAIASSSERP